MGRALYTGLHDRIGGGAGTWGFRQCPDSACGLLWIDPMPTVGEATAAARGTSGQRGRAAPVESPQPHGARRAVRDGYLALAYGCRRERVRPAQRLLGLAMYPRPLRRAALAATMMHLPVRSGGRLLDIGSGTGDGLHALAEAGWRAEGLDVDPERVARARARGLEVRLGVLEAQSYPTGVFDAVTMSHSIEHVDDPAAVLREAYRVLAPGGRLALLTPNARSLAHRWFRSDWLGLDPPRHVSVFTRTALRRLLSRAGFRLLRVAGSARDAHLVAWASQSIRRTARVTPDRPPPAGALRAARAFRWAEWAAQRLGLDVAEELVVVAEKPGR